MDINVDITLQDINIAIQKSVKALARKEVDRMIKEHYLKNDDLIKEEIRKIAFEMVTESFKSPDFVEFLKSTASEVARIKASQFIRKNEL